MQGPPYTPPGGAPPPGGFGGAPPGGYGGPPPGGFGGAPPGGYGGPPPGYAPQGYAPHGQMPAPGAYQAAGGLACPRCGCTTLHMPSYTWWGGVLGPWLLKHTVCQQCQFAFNRKTGKANDAGTIILYTVGILVVFGVLFGGCGLVAALTH